MMRIVDVLYYLLPDILFIVILMTFFDAELRAAVGRARGNIGMAHPWRGSRVGRSSASRTSSSFVEAAPVTIGVSPIGIILSPHS